MSFPSTIDSIYANQIQLTSQSGTDVDIVCTTGNVLINGVLPTNGGPGGGILPPNVNGTGDLTTLGNIRATGNGVTTGRLEGEIIKATTGNIIATAGNIEVLTGNVEISGTGGLEINGTGKIRVTSGNVEVQAGNVEISGTGGLAVKGTGEIKTEGGGNITAGLSGDVQTTTGDIVSGNKIFFDGDDIYHRTNNPPAETSYVVYKQLPQLNAGNTFTGANKFNSNTTEFSAKVSVGTRDVGGLFTQNLALNTSGNIESKTINNNTTITCGNITCDNGGDNSCAARVFTTRTSGLAGWEIEQQTAQGNQLDNVLQIKGGQAGAYISIVNSGFAGFVPNIVLDPQTEAEGGKIVTDNYTIGDSNPNMFAIKQPKTGVDSNNLIIQGSALDGSIKFQNNAGTIDLVKIEPDSVDGSGRIYCPAIFFGTTGIHNSIVNDIAGPESLVMKIRQATASSEVQFLDNADAEIIRIQKTQVELGNTIPILFGNYSFRPQQFYKDITGFSFNHASIGGTNLLFNTGNPAVAEWTNVNTGVGSQGIDLINNPGAYKITIRQTTQGTLGQINGMLIMSDIVLSRPNDNSPNVELAQPTAYSYNVYDGQAPIITMVPGFLTWAVHATFPNTTGNETANIRVTLTQMPYFA